MDNNLLTIPPEILTQTVQSSDLDNFIRLWSTGDKVRERLDTGLNVVKVSRLLLPLYKD